MNSSNLFCKIHNKRIHSFCSAEKCENIMLCNSCMLSHNKDHDAKIMESMDFNESFLICKMEKMFETIKNEDDENDKIYESLIERTERIESICISQFKEIKQEIQNVMGLINIDIRKSFIDQILENYKDFSQNENISKEQDLKKIFDQMNDYENNIKKINDENFFKYKHIDIMEEYSKLQTFLAEKKSQIICKLKEDIILFDKNFKQTNIEVSKDGLEARKINTDERKAILFNKCFSQGIHHWRLGLEDLKESNGERIKFGVLDKTEFNNSNDLNSYNIFNSESHNSWFIASENYFKNYTSKMNLTGVCASYKNLEFDCNLHCDNGIFIIEGNGIKAEANDLQNKNLYQFVSFLIQGGCVKIV